MGEDADAEVCVCVCLCVSVCWGEGVGILSPVFIEKTNPSFCCGLIFPSFSNSIISNKVFEKKKKTNLCEHVQKNNKRK